MHLLRRCRFAVCVCALIPSVARAGGGPENALIMVDPTNVESMHVANYYRAAWNIPEQNVLYFNPNAANYATFAANNIPALMGFLDTSGITDHIDYVVVMPGGSFYVYAPGLISDSCSSVSRFSISGAYTGALISDEILGGLPSNTRNRYSKTASDEARAFDSSQSWDNGVPSSSVNARRYFIGAMLGYTGPRGNSRQEILDMVDRSVAVTGTRPAGTFYFMETSDPLRSGPRDAAFDAAVASIVARGGAAAHLLGIVPDGHHDCLGIMTGWTEPHILTADATVLPGAICDHLTSYAATFDTASQEKLSTWISAGASGSWGTVEEPCNYPGKFPHARAHVYYFQGLSLGESLLRSASFMPFQGLLYGDPLTRPFAYLPEVDVADAPSSPVSGPLTLTPSATTAHPTATIAYFDLLLDGVFQQRVFPGFQFNVDTTRFADGEHELRVLAYDSTLIRSVGRWIGPLVIDNLGRATTLDVVPLTGDRSTPFVCDMQDVTGGAAEVRLTHNGRVVAAASGSSATLTVYGLTLGAGPVRVQAEALFADGRRVCSPFIELNVADADGTPSGQPPVAFSYTKRVRRNRPFVVELPAAFDNSGSALTYVLVSSPAKASVASGVTGPYRLMTPLAGACHLDSFTFKVVSPAGESGVATVTLDFGPCAGDLNCDGSINGFDIEPFVLAISDPITYAEEFPDCDLTLGDMNDDGSVNGFDIDSFVDALGG
ncbi:MAG: hypothetical protein CHACPFDD_01948 [Phycisphaerae bacterium]|nr:hypothetical protein [Phycisphaerae bacterium]